MLPLFCPFSSVVLLYHFSILVWFVRFRKSILFSHCLKKCWRTMVTMLNNVDQLNIFSLADKILVLKLELAKVSWELPLEIPLL